MTSYDIDLLTDTSVLEWLNLSPTGHGTSVAELNRELKENPNVHRFLIRKNERTVGRFAVRIDGNGMTIWWPTVKKDLSPFEELRLMRATAKFISEFAAVRRVSLIECTLKEVSPFLVAWRSCLIECGFQTTSVKREWQKNIDPIFATREIHGRANWTISRWLGLQQNLDELYIRTVSHTADMANALEAKHGIFLGEADLTLVVTKKDFPIGLYAAVFEPGDRGAWNKYIGIVPEWRRKGAGAALLRRGLIILGEKGLRHARSLIDESNNASIALHHRLGFTKTPVLGETLHCEL